jgi:hypothetical protein
MFVNERDHCLTCSIFYESCVFIETFNSSWIELRTNLPEYRRYQLKLEPICSCLNTMNYLSQSLILIQPLSTNYFICWGLILYGEALDSSVIQVLYNIFYFIFCRVTFLMMAFYLGRRFWRRWTFPNNRHKI